MTEFRNLSFVFLCSVLLFVASHAPLNAAECDVVVGACAWGGTEEENIDAAEAACAATLCVDECYKQNCDWMVNGPQCEDACGSMWSDLLPGSCTNGGYSHTGSEGPVYCASGACTGCVGSV